MHNVLGVHHLTKEKLAAPVSAFGWEGLFQDDSKHVKRTQTRFVLREDDRTPPPRKIASCTGFGEQASRSACLNFNVGGLPFFYKSRTSLFEGRIFPVAIWNGQPQVR